MLITVIISLCQYADIFFEIFHDIEETYTLKDFKKAKNEKYYFLNPEHF